MDDWLAIWDAAEEADRAALVDRVVGTVRRTYDAALAGGSTSRQQPTPEVIGARRHEERLIATVAWTYAIQAADRVEQTVGIDRVFLRYGGVSRASPIVRRVHASAGHDLAAYYRETLAELRACLVAADHVDRRLQTECDREVARGMTSCVCPVAMQVIDAERRGDRLIVTTCGWYRLYFQSISGSDWSDRYIAVDEVTIEHGQVVGERTIAAVTGGMSEREADNFQLAEQADEEHVAEVIAKFRDREARMSGPRG